VAQGEPRANPSLQGEESRGSLHSSSSRPSSLVLVGCLLVEERRSDLRVCAEQAASITSVALLPENPNHESDLSLVVQCEDPEGTR